MKRLLLALALIAGIAVQLHAVTAAPVMVQQSIGPSSVTGSVTQYRVVFPQAILTGNGLICSVSNNHLGVPSSVADDAGHTLTLLDSLDDGNNNHSLFYFNGAATGGRTVNLNYSSGVQYVHMVCSEWAHLNMASILDSGGTGAGKCKANATNTALDCSAFSTTQASSLVYYGFDQSDTLATQTSFLANSPYVNGLTDNLDSLGFAYYVQPASGAATPTVTLSASHSWQAVGGLFKYSAGAGTEPTAMRVVTYGNYTQKVGDTGFGGQFSCTGQENEIVVFFNGAAGRTVSAISSTNTTGTWAKIGDASVNGGSGATTLWHLPNSTCAYNTKITITQSGGNAVESAEAIFGIAGAATAPYDTASLTNATGNDTTHAAFTGAAVPATAAGLSLWYIGANTGAGSAIASSSSATFIGCGTTPVIDTSPVCENQGASILVIAGAGTNTITWTPNSVAIGTWSDLGANFKAAASAATAKPLTLLGVGERYR